MVAARKKMPRKPAKKKVGRPREAVPEKVAAEVCERLAAGESLRSVCRGKGMPSAPAVIKWAQKDDGFGEQYRDARLMGYHSMADSLIDVADGPAEGEDTPALVARDKLKVNTRQWIVSRMLPKIYGDRLSLAGDPDSPLKFEMSDVQAAHEITRILAIAQKRKDEEERRARTADGEANGKVPQDGADCGPEPEPRR